MCMYIFIHIYMYIYIYIPLSRTTYPAGGDGRKPKRGTNCIESVYL